MMMMRSSSSSSSSSSSISISRAEIDTRAPFRSVKEAVMLFGETVLAGEVYASTKLNEMRDGSMSNKNIGQGASSMFGFGTVRTQLQETKQSLQIAREEGMLMANCLISLKEELEETKRELQQIKSIKQQQQQQQEYYSEKQPIHSSEFEFVKFVENVNTKPETEPPPTIDDDNEPLVMEFQNKLCVKFADPPSLAHHVMMNSEEGYDEVLVEQSGHPPLNTIMNNNSKKKKKKLTMIPGLIGGIFSHKKKKKVGIQKTAFPNDRAP